MGRSTFFYTDSRVLGGAEEAMFMLLGSLDRVAWRPTLLLEDAPGVEPLAERARELQVPVIGVRPLPLGLTGARRVPALARLLRRERPRVFHAHMSSPVACKWGLAAALLARVPAVLGTVQVGGYEPPGRSAYLQLRALAQGVDRYLPVSRDIGRQLVETLGWPEEKIEPIHNAIDVARFDVAAPPGLREQLGGSEAVPLVLTPARLSDQKGHAFLFEAIREVPRARFVLAGEGPERTSLEALAARLGIADRIVFLGRREDIPELLAACDVFALPSLYEGSSLAVLEAMAAKVPIVSSAIGGTDELIDDGRSGLLVPPGDPQALAAALRRLLGDGPLRVRLALQARKRVDAGLTREQVTGRVMEVYRELLGEAPVAAETLPEGRRNPVLRREDWRFAVPGAELLDSWRTPRPGRSRRARRQAEAAGFDDVRVYWAGPLPHRRPLFWLPIESREAARHLLARRSAGAKAGPALRLVWRAARAAGLLAPLYVVGRRGEPAAGDVPLPQPASLLLLTGGHRSINKVVGLAFEDGMRTPTAAVKFARVPEAEPGLGHEARVLARLAEDRPALLGVPHLRGEGHRHGRLGIVEDAVEGTSLLDALSRENLEAVAGRVTQLLVELGRGSDRQAGVPWRRRLIEEPLSRFEREFGPAVDAELLAAVRAAVEQVGDLPPAVEHRDCSPWNILLTAAGDPILLDWESAELDGLPGIDLVYFLANCAFILDHALESGGTRESYRRLLDPAASNGRVAARAFADYSEALGISADDLHRLRLLCWVVHSHSDYRHLQLESPGTPSPEALRRTVFLGLIEEELARSPDRPGYRRSGPA